MSTKKLDAYSKFKSLDGNHSFKQAVPGGYVDYQVRTRRPGKVLYFNFNLAKEMGLIPIDHPHQLNRELSKVLLQTFGIQVINEWDKLHKIPILKKDIRPKQYMATRYLQLQHPDKRGTTSGDGRGIWNGQVTSNGVTWDVSSCGTGATCLSPATAIQKKFFKTGDPSVSYGCGYADLSDGIAAALMSETFHRNGIKSERTLLLIEYPNKLSINVRAGKNLLRPSHFFHHFKQGNFERLKGSIDHFINQQISNGEWAGASQGNQKYDTLIENLAKCFASICAQYETEYIFVWLDWDGDNILTDGGIIDYGSVRQFGLYHHEYRYDDVDRFSTTIPEQKLKAKHIVHTFIQIADYLKTGKKNKRSLFKNHPALKLFKTEFESQIRRHIVAKIGINQSQQEYLLDQHPRWVKNFQTIYSYFEKAKSHRGKYQTNDGITQDAIFCIRDILREFPFYLLSRHVRPSYEDFMGMIASSYASKRDKTPTPARKKKIREFQDVYIQMLEILSKRFRLELRQLLLEVTMRSSVVNRYDRLTGDSILAVAEQILKARKKVPQQTIQKLMEEFIEYQKIKSETTQSKVLTLNLIKKGKSDQALSQIVGLVHELRESI